MGNIFIQARDQTKNLVVLLGSLFWWLAPIALLLLASYVPVVFWKPSFGAYVSFLSVIIWPFTAFVILFFFKKVATYMFFKIDGFNFFGAKGNLKNVDEVIEDEVTKRMAEIKNEEKTQGEIKKMEAELNEAHGSADEYKKIAKEFLVKLREANKESQRLSEEVETLRKRTQTQSVPVGIPLDNTMTILGSGDQIEDQKMSNPKKP